MGNLCRHPFQQDAQVIQIPREPVPALQYQGVPASNEHFQQLLQQAHPVSLSKAVSVKIRSRCMHFSWALVVLIQALTLMLTMPRRPC